MNPYDDEPTYRRHSRSSQDRDPYDEYGSGHDSGRAEPPTRNVSGRASVGRASASSQDGYGQDGRGYSEPTTNVGRASVGRASVSGSPRPAAPDPEPVYGAPYGEAAYGSDSSSAAQGSTGYGSSGYGSSGYGSSGYGSSGYGASGYGASGSDPYGPSAPVSPSRGSAPVSPSVGRAQVRPVSPGSAPRTAGGGGAGPGGRGPGGRGPGGPGGRPVPGAPGGDGPGGPGDPGDPAGRRPFAGFGLSSFGDQIRRRVTGRGRPTSGKGAKALAARRARIRNIVIASVAVLIILTGAGFVVGTYYVDSVDLLDATALPETSTIYYSDGQTVLAKLGENTRYVVNYDDMSPFVTEAIVASEDNSFWTNSGVDFWGIMRAAWNNVTGGATQGASTLTQQYARLAFDLKGATYNRKIREAVFAYKLSQKYSKQQILGSYLNEAEFGRNTFGAEAAAKAFFGKSIKKDAPPDQQITRSEAIALVGMVKQPYPDPVDPIKYPGYDPTVGDPGSEQNTNAISAAQHRWDYVRGRLEYLSKSDPQRFTLTADEDAKLAFPDPNPAKGIWLKGSADSNADAPQGLVINHVLDELSHTPGTELYKMSWQQIRDGGYQIVATLDANAEKAAINAADETVAGSVMNGQPNDMQAALVAVEPGTGRVLAYYGGHKGSGSDFAGMYYDEQNLGVGFGSHPPGSSFKIYTLGAALKAGYSLQSYWQWTPHVQEGRNPTNPVRNASDCKSDLAPPPAPAHTGVSGLCSLLESTTQSLNIPFYDVTVAVSPTAVLQMAYNEGVQHIWNDSRQRIDLATLPDISQATKQDGIGAEVGIGQYGITVQDHANGAATIASGGIAAKEHFVIKVTKDGKVKYGETLPAQGAQRVLNQQQINDETYAMSLVDRNHPSVDGYQTANKTGTWEYNQSESENAHAWNVGFTTKLAAAVWVGPKQNEHALISNANPAFNIGNGTVWGSTLPATIWRKFINDASQAMNLPKDKTQFNAPSNTGDVLPPAFPSPTPTTSPTPPPATTTDSPTGKPSNTKSSGSPTASSSTSPTP
jgi:membrane peptidoglycan carboxypeptidase